MTYRVFARKYRPQRFQEVVGQRSIIQTLQNAISSQKLAQAYLFVGPRGVGKTSIARIFAKALNCHNGVTTDPCGQCPACLEIAEGHSMDVLEIDGASNNSVESIRTLRENAAFAPARGPYKIYLIDEVHMLTTAAFNALLKTLEEPPTHVKFIFATTEAQKLPATITSRCQRFDLSRLTEKEIADHLLHIAEKEKVVMTPKAALIVARGADGALRDAESMLDQLVAFCGEKISEEDVHHIFGFTPSELVFQLGRAILSLDVPAALQLIQEQSAAGKDLARLLNDLIHFFRDLLVASVHPALEETRFSEFQNQVAPEKLLSVLEELGKAEERFRWATDKKLQFEVIAIKMIHLLQEVNLSEVLDVLANIRGGAPLSTALPSTASLKKETIATAPFHEASATITKTTTPPAPVEKIAEQKIIEEKIKEPTVSPAAESSPVAILETGESEVKNASRSVDDWKPVAALLAAESPLKFGWLTAGSFVERSEFKMVVEFPPSCEAQTETLFWPQARKKIQECLSKNLGEKIELVARFTGEELPEEPLQDEIPEELAQQKEVAKAAASLPQKPAPASSAAAKPAPASTLTPQELEEFKNDPLIQKALEIFEAEIVLS